MPVWAITGNFGSGKTTVLNLFKEKGISTFDCDKIIKGYFSPSHKIFKKIVKYFPEVKKGRFILRRKLAKIVFNDVNKLKLLEKIIHPEIIEQLKIWIKENKNKKKLYIAEVPLLYEKKLENYFEKVILVTAPFKKIILRLKKRGFQEKEIKARRKRFLSDNYKIKRADFVIENEGSFLSLKKKVEKILKNFNKGVKLCQKVSI